MVNNHEVYWVPTLHHVLGCTFFFFSLSAESSGWACRGLPCFISDQSSWCWTCTFTWIISLNPPKGPIMVAIFFLFSPFYVWENWGLGKLILKLKWGRARFETQSCSRGISLSSSLGTHSVSIWLCARITWWILYCIPTINTDSQQDSIL